MLNYIITFFILAVIAAFLGFGGLAADFAGIAKFLAMVFVLLFIAIVNQANNSPLSNCSMD